MRLRGVCMNGWKALALGLALWTVAGPPARAAQTCDVQDHTPAFARFLAATKDAPPPVRADRFLTEFAASRPDFYAPEVFGRQDQMRDAALALFDPARRPRIPGYPEVNDARLVEFARLIGPAVTKAQRSFDKAFPDFRCRAFVGISAAFFQFDGHTYADRSGRTHLLFGLELIALLHDKADLPAFFDHELFHLYQSQVGPRSDNDELVWRALWKEGLATYASRRLNPGLSVSQVLFFPTDLKAQVDADRPRIAGLLLQDLDSADGYGRWFQARPSPGIPMRSGYYLGYLLAEHLGRGKSLAELARMPSAQVRSETQAFLETLARSSRPGAPA